MSEGVAGRFSDHLEEMLDDGAGHTVELPRDEFDGGGVGSGDLAEKIGGFGRQVAVRPDRRPQPENESSEGGDGFIEAMYRVVERSLDIWLSDS